jgi:hypothetical protein
VSIFDNVDVPEEFRARLGPRRSGPCAFLRNRQTYARPEPDFCAWTTEDVAAVIYAQSYLMHVLTGPDRRRYEGVPETMMTLPIENAKETREPDPCFRWARSDAFGMLLVELLGPGHVPFVSGGTSLRFFTPSLAMRAARELQRQWGEAALSALTTYPNDGSRVFGNLLAGEDRERLARELAAMQIPLDRFDEFEFMGCHVCLDKPATLKANKVPGLQVCSPLCYQQYKIEAKNNKGK